MIKDSAKYYGIVLYETMEKVDFPITFEKESRLTPGFFLINRSLPIYIKYSTSRFGPWVFNLNGSHRCKQRELFDAYGECVIALVCGSDGIAALPHSELQKIMGDEIMPQESISVRRRRNEMYRISGRNAALDRKISGSSLSEIVSGRLRDGTLK